MNIREGQSVIPIRMTRARTTLAFQPDAPLQAMPCHDPDFDETVVDFSDVEYVTITQIDEHGKTHTVVLSPAMVEQTQDQMRLWKKHNNIPSPRTLKQSA